MCCLEKMGNHSDTLAFLSVMGNTIQLHLQKGYLIVSAKVIYSHRISLTNNSKQQGIGPLGFLRITNRSKRYLEALILESNRENTNSG